MRRALTTSLICAMVMVVAPSVAWAGGSVIDPVRIDGTGGLASRGVPGWAAPGATITLTGAFCGAQADPLVGGWSAYLRRDPNGQRLPLGPVTIGGAGGPGCHYRASVTFAVPPVASGLYWVDVCADASCTKYVGDLVGGQFLVADTAFEARQWARIRLLLLRLHSGANRHRHLVAAVTHLTARLDVAREAGVVAEATAAVAATHGELTASRLAAAQARANTFRALAFPGAIGAFLALWGAWFLGKRRRKPPIVPEALVASRQPGSLEHRV